jgi:hypothetical protein
MDNIFFHIFFINKITNILLKVKILNWHLEAVLILHCLKYNKMTQLSLNKKNISSTFRVFYIFILIFYYNKWTKKNKIDSSININF